MGDDFFFGLLFRYIMTPWLSNSCSLAHLPSVCITTWPMVSLSCVDLLVIHHTISMKQRVWRYFGFHSNLSTFQTKIAAHKKAFVPSSRSPRFSCVARTPSNTSLNGGIFTMKHILRICTHPFYLQKLLCGPLHRIIQGNLEFLMNQKLGSSLQWESCVYILMQAWV